MRRDAAYTTFDERCGEPRRRCFRRVFDWFIGRQPNRHPDGQFL